MKTFALALAAATALGFAAPVAADTAAGRMQLAQAQGTDTPMKSESGGGQGATQRSGSTNRDSGAANRDSGGSGSGNTQRNATGDNARSGQAADRGHARGGRDMNRGERSRLSVGVRVRGGDRTTVRTRYGSSRSVIRGRVASGDDSVVIRKKKKLRRYVHDDRPNVVIKKKKYRGHVVRYDEPSTTIIRKKRRPGVFVEGGVSTRTSVRHRGGVGVNIRAGSREGSRSTTVRSGGSRDTNVGAGNQGGGQSGQASGSPSGGSQSGQATRKSGSGSGSGDNTGSGSGGTGGGAGSGSTNR